MEKYKKILKNYFNYDSFRENQFDIINKLIQKRDVYCRLSTGSGKSLLYQMVSLITNKITIVVSPLRSLKNNQVLELKNRNIKAIDINEDIQNKDIHDILNSKYLIIYITPEKLIYFIQYIKILYDENRLCLIAIDEAHCIVEWGLTFRDSYTKLSKIKLNMPNIPILATTATSTTKTRNLIIKILKLKNVFILESTTNKKNLNYNICKKKTLIKDVNSKFNNIINHTDRTIIYCYSKKQTEKICELLKKLNFKVEYYHSDVKNRKYVEKLFFEKSINIIVATISFGLGINIPDIRNIIIYYIPDNMENYVQQNGRAGRDGNISSCYLFYNINDINRLNRNRYNINSDNMLYIEKYIFNNKCRRKFIMCYFNEDVKNVEKSYNKDFYCCDNCKNYNNKELLTIDVTKEILIILNLIKDYPNEYKSFYIKTLKGNKKLNLINSNYYSKLDYCCYNFFDYILINLCFNSFLKRNYQSYKTNKNFINYHPTYSISKKAFDFIMNNNSNYYIKTYKNYKYFFRNSKNYKN